MKKLLVVVVLCLIFGGNAFAKEIILSQCYNSKIAYADGDPVDQETINQLITKEFDKSKWIEVKFEFDLQKNIFRKVMISTDEALETARKKNPDLPLNKIHGFNGKIEYADENFIKGSKSSMIYKHIYEVDVNSKTINLTQYILNLNGKEIRDMHTTIICEKSNLSKGNNIASSGSGFFINNKGYFVTNNHVVEGCAQSKITFNEKSIDAELIATDQSLDLALLKTDVRPKEFLNLSNDPPEKLQKIYVAGYPFGKGLSDDLKFTQGIISSVKGFADNSNQIQIDAAINSGNSGGPIINEDGDLVAVAVSGLDKSASEGIGFGIKANSLINFLEVNNVKYSTPGLLNFGMNSNKLNDLLEKSTVYTFCK